MGSDVFNLAVDALMVMAITGLWVMWFQQSAQRRKVEKILKEASEDLKAATELLDQVMHSLDANESKAENASASRAEALQQRQSKQDKLQIRSRTSAEKQAVTSRGATLTPTMAPDKQKAKTVDTAKIMRLRREGLSEKTIADQLKVPVAQVRLILLLQAPKT
ncbi:MAG: hypothetical protein Q9N02_04325 [Ghiorsea sp.]|nr:hypothetical protein [Ghiorsea sp.]